MKKSILSFLTAFTMIFSTVPFYANAEDTSAEDLNYRNHTLDELIQEHTGEDAIVADFPSNISYSNKIFPLVTVDEDQITHIAWIEFDNIIVKVREKADIDTSSIKDIKVEKSGQFYIVHNAKTPNSITDAINFFKANKDVLSIEGKFKFEKDDKNHASLWGFYYKGKLTSDEILAMFKGVEDATPENYDNEDYDYVFSTYGKQLDYYSIFKRLNELKKDGDIFEFTGSITQLGYKSTPVYCHRSYLVDGIDGDANVDGELMLADAVMIMQAIANPDKYGIRAEQGITEQGIKNADSDGDGITNSDALNIQKKLLKLT